MFRKLTLAALCAMTLAPAAQATQFEGVKVVVAGRDWVVGQVPGKEGEYIAIRMNLEHLPFRPPAMLGARQAARAFQAATGCSANLDTMYRTISGAYYARLICGK